MFYWVILIGYQWVNHDMETSTNILLLFTKNRPNDFLCVHNSNRSIFWKPNSSAFWSPRISMKAVETQNLFTSITWKPKLSFPHLLQHIISSQVWTPFPVLYQFRKKSNLLRSSLMENLLHCKIWMMFAIELHKPELPDENIPPAFWILHFLVGNLYKSFHFEKQFRYLFSVN